LIYASASRFLLITEVIRAGRDRKFVKYAARRRVSEASNICRERVV
jgi:hypothetical protein